MIDFLEVKVLDRGTLGSGGTMTSVDIFPLERGNTWRYVKKSPETVEMNLQSKTAEYRILKIDSQPVSYDGVSVFPLQTAVNQAPLAFDLSKFGVPTDGMVFGLSSSGVSSVSDGFFPGAGSRSTMELWDIIDSRQLKKILCSNMLGLFIYGGDTTFNANQPWRMTGMVVTSNSQTVQT
ncbi:MAG: hypothetical protein PHD82_13705, partial [Candidatus Riflebacteria bacterium]|nr:hypothetical protein [Candidatus Riflebacteria bacterium]